MPYNEDTMDPAYYSKFPVWSRPDSAWNAFYNYYPGNNYVDWIATTNINSGDDSFGGFWKPLPMFVDYVMSNAQKRFPSKPQMVIMASVEDPSNRNRKAAWITQAYQELKKYPRVRAVAWQQEGDSRWAVNSSTTSLQAYKTAVADPYYKSTPPAP
jgi:beta-mannanase